jgi:ubiquinol oxidase
VGVLFGVLWPLSAFPQDGAPAGRLFEEEAVISYTHYLKEIDEGRSPNGPAPDVARRYWKLGPEATLRDVVLLVRADEAHHRDVNHGFAGQLQGLALDLSKVAPYPAHAVTLGLHAPEAP